MTSGPMTSVPVLSPGVRLWPPTDPPASLGGLLPSWGRVEAAEQAAATAFLAQLDALLGLYDDNRRGIGTWWGLDDAQLVAEVGIVGHLGEYAVERRLQQALTVRYVPLLRTLLETGRLGVPHAVAAIDEVADYGEDIAERVLQDVLLSGDEPGWDDTPGKLVAALRRRVQQVDPAGCQDRRQAKLAAATGVRLKALQDGLASLTATGSGPTIQAARTLLDHLAGPTGPDDGRTPGQRQVDALCNALVQAAGVGVPAELQLEIPVDQATPDPGPTPGVSLEPVVIRTDLTGDLLALLSGTPLPPPACSHPDHGPEPESHDEDDVSARARAWEDASAAQVESAEQEPSQPEIADSEPPHAVDALPEPVAAPTGSPGRPRRRKPRGGVTELENVGPVDRGLLNDLLGPDARRQGLPVGLSGLTVRRLLIDPTGQVIATDPVALPLARLLSSARPAPPGRRGGADDEPLGHSQLLRALLTGLPQPPPDTAAYQPTAAQRRVVRARDPRCTFPGCRRPARTSELDHRDPFPAGATGTLNLHPLCKHHHDLKHAGFHPTRHPDGSTTWTTPHGHRGRTRPD